MKRTIILISALTLFTFLVSAQMKTGTELDYFLLLTSTGNQLKSANPQYINSKVDSVIVASDSVNGSIRFKYVFTYSKEKVTVIAESCGELYSPLEYSYKREYYMHGTMPHSTLAKFDMEAGGRTGDDWEMFYENYVGDTAMLHYEWDEKNNIWKKYFKLKHYATNDGVDTLTLMYRWDTINKNWSFKDSIKISLKSEKPDTISIGVYNKNGEKYYDKEYTGGYNKMGQLVLKKEVSKNKRDSLVYKENGKLEEEFRRFGEVDYFSVKIKYKYDQHGRVQVVTMFYRIDAGSEWEYSTATKIYYPEIIDPSRINERGNDIEVKFYPNPVKERFHIENYEGKAFIYNQLGKQIRQTEIKGGQTINVHGLQSGIYFIQLENGQSQKFIKE